MCCHGSGSPTEGAAKEENPIRFPREDPRRDAMDVWVGGPKKAVDGRPFRKLLFDSKNEKVEVGGRFGMGTTFCSPGPPEENPVWVYPPSSRDVVKPNNGLNRDPHTGVKPRSGSQEGLAEGKPRSHGHPCCKGGARAPLAVQTHSRSEPIIWNLQIDAFYEFETPASGTMSPPPPVGYVDGYRHEAATNGCNFSDRDMSEQHTLSRRRGYSWFETLFTWSQEATHPGA